LLTALSIILPAWIATGCCSSTDPSPPPIQQNLLATCPDLPDLDGVTGSHVLHTMTAWGAMYQTCQVRHGALVEAVDKTP